MDAELDVTPAARNPPTTREYRAVIAFLGLATFGAVIWLLVAVGARPVLPVVYLVTLAIPLLTILVLVIEAWGLAGRRAWAVAACTPMLVILLVAGIVSFVVALLQARLDIPLGALLAWWALRAAPEPRPEPARGGLTSTLLLGGLLLFSIAPLLTPVILTPGGLFLAGRSDLDASMTLDCGPTSSAGPETIVATYRWSWRRAELVAGGTDQIAVSWFANGWSGSDSYSLRGTELGPGLSEANRMIGGESGVVFAVDLATSRFEPGQARVTLQREVDLESPHGSIELRARYAHGPADIYDPVSATRWDANQDARCEW